MFCVEANNARQFTTTRHLQPCRPITPTMAGSLQLAVQTLSNPTATIMNVFATGDGAGGVNAALICSTSCPHVNGVGRWEDKTNRLRMQQ